MRSSRLVSLGGLVLLAAVATGCTSSSASSSGGTEQPLARRELAVESLSVSAMQVVTLRDTQASFAQGSYDATLGGQPVTLVRANAFELWLVVPADASGALALTLTADGFAYPSVTFEVAASPVVSNPSQALDTLVTNITADASAASTAWASDARYKPIAQALSANAVWLKQQIAALSAEEKAQLASFLAANGSIGNRTQSWREFWETGAPALTQMAWGATLVAGGITTAGVGGAVVAIAGAAVFLEGARDAIQAYKTMTEEAFAVADGDLGTVSSQLRTMSAVDGTLKATNKVAVGVPLQVRLTNLSAADLSAQSVARRYAATVVQGALDAWPKINEVFPTDLPALPSFENVPRVERTGRPTSDFVANLRASGDSTTVTVASGDDANGATLTFTGAQCDVDKAATVNFTLSFRYAPGFPYSMQDDRDYVFSGELACGGDCNGRFVVVDPGTGRSDGSGLVKDTSTGRTWARFEYYPGYPPGQTQAQAAAYCAGRGMRLPTKDEALAIAGNNYCRSAWPAGWFTWTSTSAGAGVAWIVHNSDYASQNNVDYGNGGNGFSALCVR